MQVSRKTVNEGIITSFEFSKNAVNFLIKNFTDDKIYVCLNDVYDENSSALIASGNSEYLEIDEEIENATAVVTVYAVGTGEIEIQAIKFSEVLTDIEENLDVIANGVYGKDVRKAIHDSIQFINNKLNKLEQGINKS